MSTSGVTTFNLNMSDLIEEAFERCGSQLRTGYDFRTARRSVNMLTIEWANRGINLWTIEQGTIPMVQGQTTYDLPDDTIDLLEQQIRTNAGQQQQYMQQTLSRDDSLNKLKRLDEINATISKVSQTLIQFFDELTKDKLPPAKLKQAKNLFEESIKFLKKVEIDLLNEINHLNVASTGHPHEGSIYGARKDYDLTKMQLNLIGAQLSSLRETLDLPLKKDFYESDSEDDGENENEIENSDKSQKFRENSKNNNIVNGHGTGKSDKEEDIHELTETKMNF